MEDILREGMESENSGGNILEDKEQIQAYIKKLQEEMSQGKTHLGAAPLNSIPSFIFIIAFILLFSTIGNQSRPQ